MIDVISDDGVAVSVTAVIGLTVIKHRLLFCQTDVCPPNTGYPTSTAGGGGCAVGDGRASASCSSRDCSGHV